jgi:hypothetical protein
MRRRSIVGVLVAFALAGLSGMTAAADGLNNSCTPTEEVQTAYTCDGTWKRWPLRKHICEAEIEGEVIYFEQWIEVGDAVDTGIPCSSSMVTFQATGRSQIVVVDKGQAGLQLELQTELKAARSPFGDQWLEWKPF